MPLFGRSPKPVAAYERELGAFAAEVDRLSGGDAMFLRAQWNELDPAERDRARNEARSAIEASGRTDIAKDVETSLVRWAAGSHLPYGTVTFIELPTAAIDRDARPQSLEVLRDVCYALIARDLISEESFAVLYEPWRALVEDEGDEPLE
jgi:hypothetical protein